jgi:hypothetical protein
VGQFTQKRLPFSIKKAFVSVLNGSNVNQHRLNYDSLGRVEKHNKRRREKGEVSRMFCHPSLTFDQVPSAYKARRTNSGKK